VEARRDRRPARRRVHPRGAGRGLSHTHVPEDNWAVMVIDGPRIADGAIWWDTSRRAAGDPSGGTGWVRMDQNDTDCFSPAPNPMPAPNPHKPNTWLEFKLVNPNPAAAFTKVHFARLELGGKDSLVLYDGNGNRVQTFGEKTRLANFWSDDVPGRVVKVELNADGYYGEG